ncbi:hypothetical protein TraAM80_08823 [Trypanosoma rangeli]|uniref:Uncharacterized protein n=1 Tax=Trypanosoma rangeli TaxID=5698 RepID=A0A422MYV7_TRYRA|nr:uncharacterized protein TraAM80_08823 [Trypanosoma rangeli]RNE98424.1 hypothetical protein TraAM80_08823 [Trypanosoma rangeli]|eukprot:RNE98424.1 hypothetical protein TraAM80_08823 [Trypanosoma rangeli]
MVLSFSCSVRSVKNATLQHCTLTFLRVKGKQPIFCVQQRANRGNPRIISRDWSNIIDISPIREPEVNCAATIAEWTGPFLCTIKHHVGAQQHSPLFNGCCQEPHKTVEVRQCVCVFQQRGEGPGSLCLYLPIVSGFVHPAPPRGRRDYSDHEEFPLTLEKRGEGAVIGNRSLLSQFPTPVIALSVDDGADTPHSSFVKVFCCHNRKDNRTAPQLQCLWAQQQLPAPPTNATASARHA